MQDNGIREPEWKNDGNEPEKGNAAGYYTYDEPEKKEVPFAAPPVLPLKSVEAEKEGEFTAPQLLQTAPYEYYDEPAGPAEEADISGFTKAGFWTRFCAWLLDGAISGIAGLLLSGILLLVGGSWVSQPLFFTLTPARILFLAVRVVYRVATTFLFGGTLGKRALRIRLVSTETGDYPTFWQAFFRETFGKYLSTACLGIGYLMVFSEKGTMHDRLADTAVVYDL